MGGGGAELGDDDEGVVEDGVDPAAVVVEAAALADAPDEPDAELAAPPCFITR